MGEPRTPQLGQWAFPHPPSRHPDPPGSAGPAHCCPVSWAHMAPAGWSFHSTLHLGLRGIRKDPPHGTLYPKAGILQLWAGGVVRGLGTWEPARRAIDTPSPHLSPGQACEAREVGRVVKWLSGTIGHLAAYTLVAGTPQTVKLAVPLPPRVGPAPGLWGSGPPLPWQCPVLCLGDTAHTVVEDVGFHVQAP